jgi:hypothetical protein
VKNAFKVADLDGDGQWDDREVTKLVMVVVKKLLMMVFSK